MAIKTPSSVNAQSGTGGPNVRTSGVRAGGKNQGKSSGKVSLNTAHPRTQGQ